MNATTPTKAPDNARERADRLIRLLTLHAEQAALRASYYATKEQTR